jgi:hypothetical protein
MAYEFLMLTGFFLIVFAGVMLIATQRSAELGREQAQAAAADVTNIMTREIRYAYIGGEGYSRTFVIPRTLNGVNYSIMILNYSNTFVSGIPSGAPQAAILLVNASNLPAPSMLPLPYRVELRYVDRTDAALKTTAFTVTLELPAWVNPG